MDIVVTSTGLLTYGDATYQCVLGRSGTAEEKREGDGATPLGCFSLREVLYRPDKVAPPLTCLPITPIQQLDGWCDDPHDKQYNTKITLPSHAHHENLWRDDDLYDLVVVIGYNDEPVQPGKGSAIFLHVAHPTFSPTEGCIAMTRTDLTDLLCLISSHSRICITT